MAMIPEPTRVYNKANKYEKYEHNKELTKNQSNL